jgi:hypothetical protein
VEKYLNIKPQDDKTRTPRTNPRHKTAAYIRAACSFFQNYMRRFFEYADISIVTHLIIILPSE